MSRFKRLLASLSSVALVVTSVLVFTPATQAATFSDVPSSSPFFTFVEDLASRGIISTARATYNPTMPATRGELVKIVVNATGTTINTTGGPTFSDVPVGSPFYTFVETAVNNGWVSGYGDGTFGPNNKVTRGEAAKIIANAFGLTLLNPSSPSFSDVSPSNVFYSYIETLAAAAIITTTEERLSPMRCTYAALTFMLFFESFLSSAAASILAMRPIIATTITTSDLIGSGSLIVTMPL